MKPGRRSGWILGQFVRCFFFTSREYGSGSFSKSFQLLPTNSTNIPLNTQRCATPNKYASPHGWCHACQCQRGTGKHSTGFREIKAKKSAKARHFLWIHKKTSGNVIYTYLYICVLNQSWKTGTYNIYSCSLCIENLPVSISSQISNSYVLILFSFSRPGSLWSGRLNNLTMLFDHGTSEKHAGTKGLVQPLRRIGDIHW